jgi:hypothetical protein
MSTAPLATFTATKLARVCPAVTFRFDASGRPVPDGYTVRKPPVEGSVAVTLSATAVIEAGRPSATRTVTVPPGPTARVARLSKRRTGATGVKGLPVSRPVACQPATSATRWLAPEELKIVTLPPAPIFTTTAFANVWPATKLALDANGRGSPVGYTVRKPSAVGSVTVTLRDTAVAPVAGTPAVPVTWTSIDWPGPAFVAGAPSPIRVSRIRVGVTGMNPPDAGAVWAGAAAAAGEGGPEAAGTRRARNRARTAHPAVRVVTALVSAHRWRT